MQEHEYKWFRMVENGHPCFAVSKLLLNIDISNLSEISVAEFQETSAVISARNTNFLKELIDKNCAAEDIPVLIGTFLGYNVVNYLNSYWAFSLSLGIVDLSILDQKRQSELESLHMLIKSSDIDSILSDVVARLYGAKARVMFHKGYYFFFPDGFTGKVPSEYDLSKPETISAESLAQLKEFIDRYHLSTHQRIKPLFVEQYKYRKIYKLAEYFIAQGAQYDELDLVKVREGNSIGAITETSADAIRSNIDGAPLVLSLNRALVVCNGLSEQVERYVDEKSITGMLQLGKGQDKPIWDYIPYVDIDNQDEASFIRPGQYDMAILPCSSKLDGYAWEQYLVNIVNRIVIIYPDGRTVEYNKDDCSRIIYNMSYLRSMLSRIPDVHGAKVIEIGCSDGLTCNIMSHLGPAEVTGVDVLDTVGLGHLSSNIRYHCADFVTMDLPANYYDLTYSIATFEHIRDTESALSKMLRITKPGGFCYVQAGPMYYSSCGHHMFGFFDDHPWIHVLYSKAEICRMIKSSQALSSRFAEKNIDVTDYIYSMINRGHLNGKRLSEYNLDSFMSDPCFEVVHFSMWTDKQHAVTDEMLRKLPQLAVEDFTSTGFELLIQKKRV